MKFLSGYREWTDEEKYSCGEKNGTEISESSKRFDLFARKYI